jgi:hypothetical protein
MGLGKTLTMIALVLKQKQQKPQEEEEDWLSRDKQLEKGQHTSAEVRLLRLIVIIILNSFYCLTNYHIFQTIDRTGL